MSPEVAASFLAWLADSDSVSASTIAGYKSGMRHHWMAAHNYTDDHRCPFTSSLADATLAGIRRALAPTDRALRDERRVTESVGPTRLVQLHHILHPPGTVLTDEQAMMWGAATLGSYGLLRPNEFLGSYHHADRKLRPEQITFFIRRGDNEEAVVGRYNGPPQRYQVALGATKADQLGTNKPIVVDARIAVEALWCWMRRRVAYSAADQLGPVFKLQGRRPLSIRRLLDHLGDAMRLASPHTEVHLTGRCFRRGGATDLVRAGASLAQVQHAGRWLSSAMVYTYAEPAVVREREAAAAAGASAPLRLPTTVPACGPFSDSA